jgi:hypothetical protein
MNRLETEPLVDAHLLALRSWKSSNQQRHQAHRPHRAHHALLPLVMSVPLKEDCIRPHDMRMLRLSGKKRVMEGPW